MKVFTIRELIGMGRKVNCPNGGFISYRALIEKDDMGFSMTKTIIPRGAEQHWHYKNHLEACYCISGYGTLTDLSTGNSYEIAPDTFYVLDKNDNHLFEAHEDVALICVFNPPLKGNEIHNEEGAYDV